MESRIQGVESGIQRVESGIRGVESGIQGVESGIQGVESGIQGVESVIQRPPGLPHMGRSLAFFIPFAMSAISFTVLFLILGTSQSLNLETIETLWNAQVKIFY